MQAGHEFRFVVPSKSAITYCYKGFVDKRQSDSNISIEEEL